MVTGQLLPNAAQHLWIYGTATANYADILAHSATDADLAQDLARTAAQLRALVLRAGQPYHDPAAEAEQLAAQRAQASLRRWGGQ